MWYTIDSLTSAAIAGRTIERLLPVVVRLVMGDKTSRNVMRREKGRAKLMIRASVGKQNWPLWLVMICALVVGWSVNKLLDSIDENAHRFDAILAAARTHQVNEGSDIVELLKTGAKPTNEETFFSNAGDRFDVITYARKREFVVVYGCNRRVCGFQHVECGGASRQEWLFCNVELMARFVAAKCSQAP